ncbi:MAG: ferrous iron transport protein B [Rikenellaceae bacterium]|jgi:ferrous iron transport protein B|nr:ferrous iron transport protein B [Rikenellaceae bacterium]
MKSDASYRRLSELGSGEVGTIVKVSGHGAFRKRITEMGFVRGKSVKVIRNAPLMDPVEYEIMGYHIALRRSEAALIEVTAAPVEAPSTAGAIDAAPNYRPADRPPRKKAGTVSVALVGNPNSGKTSLFNRASHSHERVGNYGGVTVEGKSAVVSHRGMTIELVDLPGTYSITEYTPEELYVRRHILDERPDVVINVVDTSNLERNLFLTTQLIDMDLKVVVALNMYDEFTASGATLDYEKLGALLGIPFVPTVASKNRGVKRLFDAVIDIFEDRQPVARHIHINYGDDIEAGMGALQDRIWENSDIVARYSSRYLALKLLEGDMETLRLLRGAPNHDDIAQCAARETARLEKRLGERVETTVAGAKYGFIAGALAETCTGVTAENGSRKASQIDRVLTHKYWGFPIFFLMMWVMFQATFILGAIPAGWIEQGVGWLGTLARGAMADGSLRDLLTDGVIGGVGGVLVFLPNILLLFFFISIFEDTGYMARAAFIMDRAMHRIGLHGKSFIPLLMGFGCNVPAIMATRTLESRKDRILTILIIPFMSCSARLPVYVLLISAFFVKWQGVVMLSIYVTGVLIAIVSSLALKRIFFRKSDAPFVMELPPYRVPTARSVVRHMWSKGSQYLRKMGTVILVASLLVWALGYYPRHASEPASALREASALETSAAPAPASAPASATVSASREASEQSYIGRLGRFIEPAIRPLGFDWHMGVSLISGAAAKEIIVSSMAVLNNISEDDAAGETSLNASLADHLRSRVYASGPRAGRHVYTPLTVYGMMIFILLYFPCLAAFAAVRKEAGLRWAIFTSFYTTALAWVVAFLVYQIGSLF